MVPGAGSSRWPTGEALAGREEFAEDFDGVVAGVWGRAGLGGSSEEVEVLRVGELRNGGVLGEGRLGEVEAEGGIG